VFEKQKDLWGYEKVAALDDLIKSTIFEVETSKMVEKQSPEIAEEEQEGKAKFYEDSDDKEGIINYIEAMKGQGSSLEATMESTMEVFNLEFSKPLKNVVQEIYGNEEQNEPIVSYKHADFKDKSAILQEEGFNIRKPCSMALLSLRNFLKKEIEEESQAEHTYKELGKILEEENLNLYSQILTDGIATEEARHKIILEIIVDIITEQCGE
jgi:bacterioferritin (cytochrome b1)